MSQVRKLLKGDKVPKYKYGHLIINGIDHGNSEDVYRQFAQYAKTQDPGQSEAYAAWLQQLANGEDAIIGIDNSTNVHPEDMSDERAGKRSYVRKVVDDVFNTDRNRFSDAIVTAGRFTPVIQPKQKTSKNNSSANFVFVGDTPVYDEKNHNNLALRERFDDYLNWLSDDLWEEDNQFSTALTENQKSALKAWYNSLEGNNPYEKRQSALKQWDENIAKVKAAEDGYDSVDEKARNFFASFNIGNASTSSATSSNGSSNSANVSEKKARETLQKAGYNPDLYKLIGDNFEIDGEGVLRSKSGDFDFGVGNAYFNDGFYKSRYGAEGTYDPLRGLTKYNGALYKNDSARLAAILNAEGSFNDLYKRGDFEGADKIIQTRWTDEELEPVGVLDSGDYSTYVTPGMQFSNITGLVTLKDGSQRTGDQIIQYIDPDSLSYDGGYAHYNYKFALLDDRGNWLRDLTNDDIQRITGGTSAGKLNTYKRTPVSQGAYANTFYEDITGQNGKESGIRIYRDINDKDGNVILHIDGLNGYASGKDVRLPREVAEILMKDRSWIEKVLKNPQARMNFTKALSSLVQDRFGRRTRDVLGSIGLLGPYGAFVGGGDWDYRYARLKELGLSKEQTKALADAFKKATTGNKWERRENYTVGPTEFRDGGKIQYIAKLAGGGFTGGTTGSQGSSETRIQSEVRDPRNAAGFSDIGSDNWTTADTKDLLAFFGDVGSLGLAFVPGANVASTATGVASSLARYSADKDRGTKGAGWQLGLNLAMDAATLLPLLGGVAKSGKLAKGVKAAEPLLKKAAKVVITSASVWGLGNAVVSSASKIANGEKFSVRDVANVVNGITAGVGIAKSGGFGRSEKSVSKVKDINIVGKDGKSLNIGADALDGVKTKKDLYDVAFAHAKKENPKITEDAFTKNFGSKLDEFINSKWTPGWKPKDWARTSKNGAFKPKTEKTTELIEPNGNWLHDWWYRTGGYQRLYNEKLIGEGSDSAKTVRTTTRTPEMEYKSSIKVGGKKIQFTKKQIETIAKTPKMKQLDAFAKVVRKQNSNASQESIETAFRKLLSSERNNFRFRFPRQRVYNVETNTVGEIPGWYRGRTEGLSIAQPQPNGIRTTVRTRVYDTRQGIARPSIILPLQLSGYSYEQPSGFIPQYNYYKKGGIIKAKNGLPSYESRKIFDSVYDPNAGLDGFDQFADEIYKKDYLNAVENSNLPEAHKRRLIADLRSQAPVQITGDFGDHNIDTSGAIAQLGKTILGAAEYGVKAAGRKDVADIQKRGLLRADYDDPYVLLQDYDTRDPYSEAQIQAINQMNANPNVNPNADYTAYLAGRLGLQAQILPALNNAYRNASQNLAQKSAANTDLHNKQSLMDQEVTSKNRARHAGTEMNLANVDAGLRMQDAMSLANAIREKRVNTEEELEKAKQFAFNRDAQGINDKYESLWKSAIGPKYSEWMNLDQSVKDNYSDINDWLQRADSNKEWWKLNENAWNSNQQALNDELQKLYMRYNLSPAAQTLYRQRYKKGGRVGRNRYKNEPEEDVWINQNKAVHKAVAKLNDNIIKIFLKTLG